MKNFYLFLLILLAGCASTSFSVKVTAISLPERELANYNNCALILATDKDEKAIINKRYISSLIDVLENSGVKIVDKFNETNCVIFFDYGISEPQLVNYTTVIPSYGVTGISSSTSSGNIHMQNTGFGNYTGTVSSHTEYTPQYGITGWTPVNQTKVLYIRYLYLEARKVMKNKKNIGDQLWNTIVTSVGSSGELKVVMPYMLYVLANNIKTNTQEVQEINIYENDEKVKPYKLLLN